MFDLSLNFFYVNIGLNAAGLTLVPSVADHPVYEALFNFINAWSLMFVPLLLTDGRAKKARAHVCLHMTSTSLCMQACVRALGCSGLIEIQQTPFKKRLSS